MTNNTNKIKNFGQFINENNQHDESSLDYYISRYKDGETYLAVDINTHEEKKYSGEEYRDLFTTWFNKIKPFLDNNDERGVHRILINWDEETLAKFDMYSLVRNYFKK